MFTGIVEEVGTVRAVEPVDQGVKLRVGAERVIGDLAVGDSVALDGVCQTAIGFDENSFDVVAIGTTLSRTTLGEFRPGRRVNLERALAYGGRVGGHFVQGHVDGIGQVLRVERRGEHRLVDVRMPEAVAEVTVLHGSIAINGVSMTVNALPGPDVAQVAVIPYTWEHTTLRDLEAGARVNLEGDLLGRFVTHYMKRSGAFGVGMTNE